MLENWSSRDVQRDPQGFLKAQQAERERKEAEAKKQQEQAAQSARAKEEAARLLMYQSRMKAV